MTPDLESYLEEIYQMSLEKTTFTPREIGKRIQATPALLFRVLKRLHREGYIQYDRYGTIGLTNEGKSLGKLIIKRNSILQEFLFIINSGSDPSEEAVLLESHLKASTIYAIENLVEFFKQEKDIMERFIRYCEIQREKKEE
ncbi:metal-dependent transcriptional regulator [Geosporobacter ferrireducens]|uniref:HTH dtxR-type domain-containing protein n=1 Tax=Geosporobacter ferrireducens TaxID=1424294 RepID=A0A1D8GDX6_9FIRM|nr:iron dependent repressor, metal binding and dimerization domain protein [Geosporobacter ferrireducens]AOT69119.1 hypothetical protein Gferi_05830 [Geosporobacter ferrireducens]